MVESGLFYSVVVDPLLAPARKRIAGLIEPGKSVIDIACGTGAQLFVLAPKVSEAVGTDLSDSMIHKARKIQQKKKISNVKFFVSDATTNWNFSDDQFDVAILSMALHQFAPENYSIILNEMKRVARKQIFMDYAVPLPKNFTGTGSRMAEFLAGKEHHRNFRHFIRNGGLPSILLQHGLSLKRSIFFGNGTFQLVVCT